MCNRCYKQIYISSPPQIKKKKGFNLFCEENKDLDLACGFVGVFFLSPVDI